MNIQVELTKTLNRALKDGKLVRCHEYYDGPNSHTVFTADDRVIFVYPAGIVYPGYLNLTKRGTPSRVIAIEDQGGFGAQPMRGIESLVLCMSHRWNSYDADPTPNIRDYEMNEDAGLDAMWE